MPSQSSEGNRGGPWGVRGGPSPDLEELLRQGQERLKGIMPGGRPRGMGMILSRRWEPICSTPR
jgi:membrane protease subunit HflK